MTRKMNVTELASFTELAPKTIYNLVYANKIPFERISEKRVVFDEDQIRKWLKNRKIETKINRSGPRGHYENSSAENASNRIAMPKPRTWFGVFNKYKYYIFGLVMISMAAGGGLTRLLDKMEKSTASADNKLKFSSSEIESLISQSKPVRLTTSLASSGRNSAKIELDYVSNLKFDGNIDSSHVKPLLVYILKNKEDYPTRSKTMDIIQPYIDDPEIRKTLIQIMKLDKDPAIRLKAATVLSRVASKEDVKRAFLERVKNDESVAVKFKLLEAIEKNIDQQMFDAMKEIMENEPNQTIKERSRLMLKKFNSKYS